MEMAEEKPEKILWSKIEKVLSRYKEFWFFLAGLLLGCNRLKGACSKGVERLSGVPRA